MASSSRFFAVLVLLICSQQIFVRCSPDLEGFLQQTESMVGEIQGKVSPCMQKILPCRPYIQSPENPPPACCLPLKEMVTGDAACLCSFFNNAEMLKTLNVTQTQALMLPKACALDVDISKCHNEEAKPPTSTDSTDASASPTSPPNTSSTTPSNGSSPSSSAMKNNPSYGIGYGFAAAFSILSFLLHFNSANLYI